MNDISSAMKSRAEIINAAKKIISEQRDIPVGKIKLKDFLSSDLGVDSLDTYELIYKCEEEFDISIPDEKANEFDTFKDAVDYIQEDMAKRGKAFPLRVASVKSAAGKVRN